MKIAPACALRRGRQNTFGTLSVYTDTEYTDIGIVTESRFMATFAWETPRVACENGDAKEGQRGWPTSPQSTILQMPPERVPKIAILSRPTKNAAS